MKSSLIAAAREEPNFKGATRQCLLTLAEHAIEVGLNFDKPPDAWTVAMSYEEIAKGARCTKRQAIRCVAKLKAAGWLEAETKTPSGSGQWLNRFKIGKPDPAKPRQGGARQAARAAEIEKLKARLAELEAEEAATTAPKPRPLQLQRR